MKRLALIGIGIAIGAALTVAPAVAAWLVTGKGEASVQLASLKPLGVEVAKIEGAWPGDEVGVRAVLKNGNARPVTIETVTLTGLMSDVQGCATGVKFTAKTGKQLAPGDAEVEVGTISIPRGLGQRCSGASFEGTLTVEAEF